MARLLVTGGAGYIGSHVVRALAAMHDVTVLDDLSQGHAEAVAGRLLVGDVTDRALLRRVLAEGFDVVLHLAALISVAESVQQPARYDRVNRGGTEALLGAMAQAGCTKLVFSSTAAIFGDRSAAPIPHNAPAAPINPYGASKWAAEQAIARSAVTAVCLRFFNAAGASEDGWLGEAHDPETHLIPIALQRVAAGEAMRLFGTDHPTPDGTAVRDYVHVLDLADAHVRAVDHLLGGGQGASLNLGSGSGASVLQVLAAVQAQTKLRFPAIVAEEARPGDAPSLVADPHEAAIVLGWTAKRDLDAIVADAWRWLAAPRFGPGAG